MLKIHTIDGCIRVAALDKMANLLDDSSHSQRSLTYISSNYGAKVCASLQDESRKSQIIGISLSRNLYLSVKSRGPTSKDSIPPGRIK